jgi:Protein of unknown function (DUF669)
MANLSSLFGNTAFKPADVEPMEMDFDPIPKGQYTIHITDSEINPTKNGNGTLLALKAVIQEGKYKNRILFDNLCVQHTNATAQAIAQTRLKQICESLKISALKDTVQMHDKPLLINVNVELDKYQSERQGAPVYRNAIKGYAPAAPAPKAASTAVEEEILEDIPF